MFNILSSSKKTEKAREMNDYQRAMYADLIAMCDSVETFYFKEHELDGSLYRVFSYHLGSYTDFCQPSALECRGSMFLMENGEPVELVSLPFPKFFNIYENPLTMNPEFDRVVRFEEKADGSLITTYMHQGNVRLKSKTSLSSIMANDANDYMDRSDNRELRDALQFFAEAEMTVIMEWCDPKPESRIVLAYDRPHLRIFGIRDNRTGGVVDYWDHRAMMTHFGSGSGYEIALEHSLALIPHSVDHFVVTDAEEFANAVPSSAGIEGYIMVLDDDTRMKIKTDWYVTQHRLKDTVTNVNALFVSVIKGSSDDLKSIFHDNQGALDLILEMEEYARARYKMFVGTVETFYEANKHLTRKDYAIKAKAEVENWMFGSVMQIYQGREVDYVETMTGRTKSVKLHTSEFNSKPLEDSDE